MKHVLNEYFDRIYCVTVHSFHDRHELSKKQLGGIDFEWIVSPPPEVFHPKPPISLSEISCIMGQMLCLWNAKLHGYKRVAIWADDGVMTATEEEIRTFLYSVPQNWDCLYMGNADWTDTFWKPILVPHTEGINKVLNANGNAFMGVQSHVFDALIRMGMQMDRAVDFKYANILGRGNSYGPSKRYFCETISIPHEKVRHLVPNLDKYIPSHISHTV
jgi:hypothetical protein